MAPKRTLLFFAARLLLAAVFIPALLLAALEVGLRLSGFGHPVSLFEQKRVDGRDLYIANRYTGHRFFPPALARTPLPEVFPVTKPASTVRIFVFGESAVQGECYRDASFARMLPVLLHHHYPDTRFEVINCGIAALNSWALKEYVRECTRYEPDLFVFYVGNNEVVGPYGPGTIFAGASAPWLTRLRVWLTGLRLHQAARTVRAWLQPDTGRWESVSMFMEQIVPPDDPQLARVPDTFAANLDDMLATAADAGVPVVLCTVAANLRSSPPFASCHDRGLGTNALALWTAAFRAGTNAQARGQWAGALESFQRAAEIDATHAELVYRMGQCELAASNCAAAARLFARARDMDGLRFRPPGTVNDRIRASTSAVCGAFLDVATLVACDAPGGIPGDELLYDHVHFSPAGHYLVASGLCARIVAFDLLPVRPELSQDALLDYGTCLARLGFTARDRQHAAMEMVGFFNQEPFSLQLNHDETMASASERLIEATHAVETFSTAYFITQYQHAVSLSPSNAGLRMRLAQAMHDAGDVPGCIREFETALHLNPALINEACALAEVHRLLGNYDDALRVLNRALRIDATHPELYYQRGHVHLARGALDEALADYRNNVRLLPRVALGYVACGDALRFLERHDEAIAVYSRGLAYDPASSDLLRRRAQSHAARGRLSAALDDLNRAVTHNPKSSPAWHEQANILMRMGSNQAAFAAYSHAIEHDHACTNAFIQRGRMWVDVDEPGRAIADFSRALELDAGNGRVHAYRAFARFRLGQHEPALRDIQAAKEKGYAVNPQFEHAVRAARSSDRSD